MQATSSLSERLRRAVDRQRLLDTATRLVAAPSRTGEAGAAADCLAQVLTADGFTVERPAAGHPVSPAVVVRLAAAGLPSPYPLPPGGGEGRVRGGRCLQYDGHLDTVHLPFVPPTVEDSRLTGSGSCDMKGGVAAAVEALRVLRDTGALTAGSVLLTAHDLHEAPWGWGEQLDRLIADGVVGDAVLIPEPLCEPLPVVGRGAAVWKVAVRRAGPPVHEVMRPPDEPSVIAAGAELVARLNRLDEQLAAKSDPLAGRETVFIGQVHSGEIYNQYPRECRLEGTRRWLPGTSRQEVEREFRDLLAGLERDTRTTLDTEFLFIRDAFRLDPAAPVVSAFQEAYTAVSGRPLPTGAKPFVDDGNCFYGRANVPAITHGARAGGQHTVNEWVIIDDLVRVAHLYALTAVLYCGGGHG
jgi:acetylornithine deacetylase/succinyl-diaminopimelate desuccinylase-like protein